MKTCNTIETKTGIKFAGLAALAISVAGISTSWAATVDTYNPDTLAAGTSPTTVTGLSDSTGPNNLTATGAPQLYGYNTTDVDPAFNGHNYIAYGGGPGLTSAAALYTGNNDRTVFAVYDTPTYSSAQNGSFNAFVAGQAPAATIGQQASWFGLESRDNNVVGNPYLVTFGTATDLTTNGQYPTPGNPPVKDQLTFALATFDSASHTETLYFAYGTSGTIGSVTATSITLNTASDPFTIGVSGDGSSTVNVGGVAVLDSSVDSATAEGIIEQAQAYYAQSVPEPASLSLLGIGAVSLLARRRRA